MPALVAAARRVHGNSYGAFGNEDDFPDVVELTLVHRPLAGPRRLSPYDYPRFGLDFPNQPSRPDDVLRFDSPGGR